MESVISLVNKLQDIFTETGQQDISLPQIVVVGIQSSGKSSVLESFVGESFLPRGEGIVTRCPIIIQLTNSKGMKGGEHPEKWCEFGHHKGRKFVDFAEVEKEIRLQTDIIAGKKSAIVGTPIIVAIHSPSVVNLTVVDLPGIVKNPTGDQPADIEARIYTMLQEYITNPNSIILAVSPANNDLATSESIKLAREVDPKGQRTLAVITKMDLMDKGSAHAHEVLSGQVIPVKLGIIGVINRSQQDIVKQKTVEKALEDEEIILKKHYPDVAHKNGTKVLENKLNRILTAHIQKCLPTLEHRLTELSTDVGAKLDELRKFDLPSDKCHAVLDVIQKFCDAYKADIFGKCRGMETDRQYAKERLSDVFGETLGKELNSVDPLQNITDKLILNALVNSRSLESSMTLPEDAFQHLVRNEIKRLEAPALHCAQLVNAIMHDIINTSLSSELVLPTVSRFPALKGAIMDVAEEMIRSRMEIATVKIQDYVDILSTFIKTYNWAFNKLMEDLVKNMNVIQPHLPSTMILNGPDDTIRSTSTTTEYELESNPIVKERREKESDEVEKRKAKWCKLVRKLVRQYFRKECANIQDYVPRSLVHTVIYFTQNNIQMELTQKLYTAAKAEELIQDPECMKEERDALVKKLHKLQEAMKYIRECQRS